MKRRTRPTEIILHKQSRRIEIAFDDGKLFDLEAELLRVYSPSAEVQGHGPGQQVLQYGKERVNVYAIEPIGNYAVVLKFDDGHDTGIYSWDLLYELGLNKDKYWKSYLERLSEVGYTRADVTG